MYQSTYPARRIIQTDAPDASKLDETGLVLKMKNMRGTRFDNKKSVLNQSALVTSVLRPQFILNKTGPIPSSERDRKIQSVYSKVGNLLP